MLASPVLIEALLEVPYKAHGRDVQEGLDCFGLIKYVYAQCGHDIPDPLVPPGALELAATFRELAPEERVQLGDVLRMGALDDEHLGLAVPGGVFHSRRSQGIVITPSFRVTVVNFYRLAWL